MVDFLAFNASAPDALHERRQLLVAATSSGATATGAAALLPAVVAAATAVPARWAGRAASATLSAASQCCGRQGDAVEREELQQATTFNDLLIHWAPCDRGVCWM